MKPLTAYPIKVEHANERSAQDRSPLVRAVLNEIYYNLQRYITTGDPYTIDLRRSPLARPEIETLKRLLGKGEINVYLELNGQTNVVETHFAGIWWITHRNLHNDIIAEFIEISRIPSILQSDEVEVTQALKELDIKLGQFEQWVSPY